MVNNKQKEVDKNINQKYEEVQYKTIELIEALSKNTLGSFKDYDNIVKDIIDNQEVLSKHIRFLYKGVAFLLLMIILSTNISIISIFLKSTIKWWSSISDSWQIFILGIPTLIFVQIIGKVIDKKVFKKLSNDLNLK